MVLRHIWVLLCGILFLTLIGHTAVSFVPSARFGIGVAVVILASFWCIAGLVTVVSELITRRDDNENEHKRI